MITGCIHKNTHSPFYSEAAPPTGLSLKTFALFHGEFCFGLIVHIVLASEAQLPLVL